MILIQQLIHYLDGFNEYFSYDKEIENLYKRLEEKKIAINHK
jgi:hypothetical protein